MISTKIQILNSRYNYFYGLLSFFLYSLSFLIGYEAEASNHLFMPLKALLILLSALLFVISCSDKCVERIKIQYGILNCVILLYEVILILSIGKTLLYIRDYPAIVNSIIWIICSVFSIIRFRSYISKWGQQILHDKNTLSLIISAFVTAGIVILLSCEPNGVMFTWDSDTLYGFIYELDFRSLYDAHLLTFHSHVVTVYAYILVLLKLLFKDIRTAYFILNSLCIIIASFGMTFLLRNLVPGKRSINYAVANAVFMLSPWICGMSTYHMYDYYIWCMFPLLIYYMFKRNWIGFFAVGVMISFSKTTGIAVFGSACVGLLITDYLRFKKNSFKDTKNWYFLFVAIVFYLFFRFGIAESTQFEDTTFGVSFNHIVHQLKLYSTANFMWIFVILTIVLIVKVFFTKKINVADNTRYALLDILISDLIFICFNLICITYRLPRYMDSHIAVVYICTLVLILEFSNRVLFLVSSMILTVISLISSFKMIDPVSLTFFNTMNVGDRTIVDFEMNDTASLEDSIVCNREYYSYEVLLDSVLTYVIKDKNTNSKVFFSLGDQPITWGYSGGRYSYGYNDGKEYFELFYDKEKNGLANGYSYDYYDSPNMIPFEIRYIFPEESLESVINDYSDNTIYYIYMPTLNHHLEDTVIEEFNTKDKKQFGFRGWKMNCIKIAPISQR